MDRLHPLKILFLLPQERNQKLKSRASQLDKQISVLISDSVALLKARMSELGIHASNTVDLLAKAKEIVGRHKQLQSKASRLQAQVWLMFAARPQVWHSLRLWLHNSS